MVNLRFVVLAAFFHAAVASPLYFMSNMPKLTRRQELTTSTTTSASTVPVSPLTEAGGLPDSGRFGSPTKECQDAILGLCP
ncbi:uncharacterized protein FOMMEDRAFT_151910 [Fomitiporia mediterranea MF3/22]|uniref:uncharacterized protein n=1 Tax=Fomitiporia mediterranea (strain MF3/22) TaxID=694068 RepID=UPI0004408C2C|nr:uncharacterized protein FOMMEDRAFT_151910 [Fomitiporia mediterranea MF3/22]EJD06625.1 hypothetical protein FOMMEDRAFT_151910 [Fomitiporia mediterranea MF3/22]